ncbi:MAG: hypothetical protein M1834_005956 [Cirrosporium novae-zelandiae]|nr:MAG: hypothetical protein M1834_005956 [Cirrosporium novae-zelandiae]
MDSEDLPRKRQKLSNEHTLESTTESASADVSMEDASHVQAPLEEANTQNIMDEQRDKEAEAGITEYIKPDIPGFAGILKKRYADFLVNEISSSGEVLHLRDLKAPKKAKSDDQTQSTSTSSAPLDVDDDKPVTPKSQEATSEQATNSTVETSAITAKEPSKSDDRDAAKSSTFEVSADDSALLHSFFDDKIVKSIIALHEDILANPKKKSRDHKTIVASAITDKELRTKIHQNMRRIFASKLETSTDGEGVMTISASSQGRSGGGRSNNRNSNFKGRVSWLELGGEYLHFTIFKENKDTMEVMAYLARQLRLPPKNFQFAGTKDRRAITVQRASVYRVFADRIAGLNKTLRNAAVGDFEYCPQGLELGDLTGNEFLITLRDCHFPGEENMTPPARLDLAKKIVSSSVSEFQNRGFINYYGLQRFGTFSSSTDSVGVKMLQEDFKGACNAILSFKQETLNAAKDPLSTGNDRISRDDKARAYAIDLFQQSGKVTAALDALPRKFSAESCIIRHLGRRECAKDFQGALRDIPRNLRLMYVHSYQSLVWNVASSERWKRYGDKVVEGDLVLVNEHKDKVTSEQEDTVDAEGEVVIHPSGEDRAMDADDRFERARALTAEEASSSFYTIFDIVLPLPGFDVLYPSNMVEFYKSFMSSERGGGLDPFNMRRGWKDISLSGGYRKLLGRPGPNPSFEAHLYKKDDEQFVETDLEVIRKSGGKVSNSCLATPLVDDAGEGGNAKRDEPKEEKDKVEEEEEEEKIAVVLKFQLGSSQYATMALRELAKSGGIRTYKPDFGGGR